jgi:hypothetical protein
MGRPAMRCSHKQKKYDGGGGGGGGVIPPAESRFEVCIIAEY